MIFFVWAQGEVQPWAIQDANESLDESDGASTKSEGLSNPAFVSKEST